MKSIITKKVYALCLAFFMFSAASFAAPTVEEPPVKPDLTGAYLSSVCGRMKRIFLDFDNAHTKLERNSGREVIETIQSQLRDSPIKDPKTLAYPSSGNPDAQNLITAYNSLWRVDTQLRPAALRVISVLDLTFVPERFYRFTLAFDYLNDETNIHSALKDFNDVFEACLATIKEMERNDVANFTPDEVLSHSNMNMFFSAKGAPKGGFDRLMRVADRYLETLKPVELKQFADDLNSLEAALKSLQQKTDEISAWLASRPANEEPLSIAAGYQLFGLRIEQLVKDGRALLEKIDSEGSKGGRIRKGTFLNGGIMAFSDIAGAEGGMPQYRTRSRRAFRTCRENYNAVAARLNERHKNEAGFSPLSW